MVSKGRKDKVVIPPARGYTCEKISLDDDIRFVIGVETEDWEITSSDGGFYDGVKVLTCTCPMWAARACVRQPHPPGHIQLQGP